MGRTTCCPAYTAGRSWGREGALGAVRDLATTRQPAASEEASFSEPDDLTRLIAAGAERGYLTFEEIASALEEAEVARSG